MNLLLSAIISWKRN